MLLSVKMTLPMPSTLTFRQRTWQRHRKTAKTKMNFKCKDVKKLLEWQSTLIIVKDTKMVLRTMVGSKWTRVAIVALVVLFVDHVLFV